MLVLQCPLQNISYSAQYAVLRNSFIFYFIKPSSSVSNMISRFIHPGILSCYLKRSPMLQLPPIQSFFNVFWASVLKQKCWRLVKYVKWDMYSTVTLKYIVPSNTLLLQLYDPWSALYMTLSVRITILGWVERF